ncbi:MAG TPA: cell wall hydrolase [Sphingomicrobium sp.]|nr:cell wall hydrolase [Sphingomicrobium sp.]
MLIAALTASSVAPAQVGPAAEPLIAQGTEQLPLPSVEELLATQPVIDPLAPVAEPEPKEEVVQAGATLAETVASLRSSNPGGRELECLAVGIYFEAKSEPLAGQLAVGHVIADRAASGRFPKTYCGVLFQRSQFSFVRGGSYPAVLRSSRDWQEAVAIAKIVDNDLHESPVGKALFFHARRVSPGWKLTRVATVGNHIFYR